MKKIICLFVIVLSLFFFDNVHAYSVNFYANATTVYVGDDVYVEASLNNVDGNFSISSSNSNVLGGGRVTDWMEGGSFGCSFHAYNVGTATIVLSSISAASMDPGQEQDINVEKYITINVIERPQVQPIEINRTYSANNYLSGLAVEGYNIIPEFDKEVLEYSMEVDYNVEKVNIQVSLEDDTATVDGAGEREVEEGKNTFIIKVTAENGNEREYVLNVLVKELNPTKVKVDKKDYSLVKKEDKLPELDNYVKTTVKIDGNDVPALKGKITKYTLVGLKDEKGDINLYIYDAKNKKYTLYNEIKFANVALYYMENNNTNYKKTTIKIKGQEVVAYKKSGLDYYLIYGMNLNTGKVNWYTYDKEEGTIQKYAGGNKISVIDNNNYLVLVYALTGISGLLLLFVMILTIKYKKKMN